MPQPTRILTPDLRDFWRDELARLSAPRRRLMLDLLRRHYGAQMQALEGVAHAH